MFENIENNIMNRSAVWHMTFKPQVVSTLNYNVAVNVFLTFRRFIIAS